MPSRFKCLPELHFRRSPVKGRMSVADQNGLRPVFRRGAKHRQARMNAAATPLSQSPESLTRDGVTSQSHAAKAT
jgi:hypothetical protein